MLGNYAKRGKVFISPKTSLASKIRLIILLYQVWHNWDVVTSKKNRHITLTYSQIIDLSLILQAHLLNLKQHYGDSSNQSIEAYLL